MDFDFLHLYEELSSINEETSLMEGNFGNPNKAFLNFAKGWYYTEFNLEPGETRVRKDNKKISDDTIKPQSTKLSAPKSAQELASDTGVNTIATDFETGEQSKRSTAEIIHMVNKSSKKDNQFAAYSKKRTNPETGEVENLYTVYTKYPSILHHMNANHDDDATIRWYRYTDNETNKKKSTPVFYIKDEKLFNYVLITANTPDMAKYGHMLIHLLAMIVASLGDKAKDDNLLAQIIDALDLALANNNNSSTIFTIYTGKEANGYIAEFTSLKGLYNAIKDNSNWAAIIDKYKPASSLVSATKHDDKELAVK